MKLSKNVLVDNIKKDILDNSVGAISPQDIRRNFLDLIDSVDLLTEFGNLESINFSTVDLRTTRVGLETLTKRKVRGYNSVDNVALGFGSLKSQIDGSQNTALGAFSLTCNMYGQDNVGIGFHSLGSTINGYANVGVGSFSLNNNKEGSFNIAIGHGAGYYVDRNKSYQFFVASHPIDEDYICSNKGGAGLVPLLLGDLTSNSLRLGVGIRDLHDGATLQVGGHTHPSVTSSYDLGSTSYRYKNIYLTSVISYPNNDSFSYNTSSKEFTLSNKLTVRSEVVIDDSLTVDKNIISNTGYISVGRHVSATSGIFSDGLDVGGSIIPDTSVLYDLGDARHQWRNAHIYNLTSNGVAKFNIFQAEEQSHFRHKTIYLASQFEMDGFDGGGVSDLYEFFDPNQTEVTPDEPLQYLMDEDLEGAGFRLGASGVDYTRSYDLTFKPRNTSWRSLSIDDAYSRSAWFSTISIETAAGRHVKTDRIINGGSIGMFSYNARLGIYLKGGRAFVGDETTSAIAGIADVNFIASESDQEEHVVSIQSPSSGVNTFLTFLDNTSVAQGIRGFKTGYISDSELSPPNFFNKEESQRPNRYIISSYNDTDFAKRCFTLLQDETEGYVGISNFDYSESMLPDTILNVRSTGNAICRLTAENDSDTEASLELLASKNCQDYGAAFQYIKNSGVLRVNTFYDGIETNVLTISDNEGTVAILNDKMATNAMLSLGNDKHPNAHLSMRHSAQVPTPTEDYGQVFTRTIEGLDLQSTLLSFMDSSGNLFNVDMTASSADGSIIDKPLGLDTRGNTFGGVRCPLSRSNLTSSTKNNTAIGYEALSELTTGIDNTAIGYKAGKHINSGHHNTFLGSTVGTANQNYAILIGTDLTTETDGEIKIGHGSSPLIEGKAHGDARSLNVNSLLIADNLKSKSGLIVSPNSNLTIEGESTSSVQTLLEFKTGTSTSNNISYLNSTSRSLTIKGDIRVEGKILFGNSTKIDNANFLDNITNNSSRIDTTNGRITNNENAFNNLKSSFDSLLIEGVVEQDISFDDLPTSFSDTPLQFYIKKKVINSSGSLVDAPSSASDPNLVLVVLRDPYLSVRKGDYIIAMRVNGEYRPITITGAP